MRLPGFMAFGIFFVVYIAFYLALFAGAVWVLVFFIKALCSRGNWDAA